MQEKAAFVQRLYTIAEIIGHNFTENQADLYLTVLGKYVDTSRLAWANLSHGLENLAMRLGPGSRFPLPAQILDAAKGGTGDLRDSKNSEGLDDDAAAREAASRIIAGIGKLGGYADVDRVREFLGPLAWECVQSHGGWNTVCEMINYQNMPTVEAQMRELAKAKIRRHRKGEDGPPGFPELGEGQSNAAAEALKLVSGTIVDV